MEEPLNLCGPPKPQFVETELAAPIIDWIKTEKLKTETSMAEILIELEKKTGMTAERVELTLIPTTNGTRWPRINIILSIE